MNEVRLIHLNQANEYTHPILAKLLSKAVLMPTVRFEYRNNEIVNISLGYFVRDFYESPIEIGSFVLGQVLIETGQFVIRFGKGQWTHLNDTITLLIHQYPYPENFFIDSLEYLASIKIPHYHFKSRYVISSEGFYKTIFDFLKPLSSIKFRVTELDNKNFSLEIGDLITENLYLIHEVCEIVKGAFFKELIGYEISNIDLDSEKVSFTCVKNSDYKITSGVIKDSILFCFHKFYSKQTHIHQSNADKIDPDDLMLSMVLI